MAFKENLLQKIRVDQLAAQVLASIGPRAPRPGSTKMPCAAPGAEPLCPPPGTGLDLYVEEADAPAKKSSSSTVSCPSTGRPLRMSSCARARGRRDGQPPQHRQDPQGLDVRSAARRNR